MDVTVPRRIRRRGAIWGVRFGQGDRNPEEEAWSAPGRRTGSQKPKRSDWHKVAHNPGGKTHSLDRLRAPRTFWQRSLNRTPPWLGADGYGARSALNSEPSHVRSRAQPHPRQTGAAERPTGRVGPSDAQQEFSGHGRNAACLTSSRTFRWNVKRPHGATCCRFGSAPPVAQFSVGANKVVGYKLAAGGPGDPTLHWTVLPQRREVVRQGN